MSDDTTDWREMREFNAVDLTNSYVLAWNLDGGSLLLDVDLCLCPSHSLYEEPRPAEKACYRPAFIDFPHCESATDSSTRGHLAESIKRFRPGKVAALKRTGEGRYQLAGEFGTVDIRADRPMVRLKQL